MTRTCDSSTDTISEVTEPNQATSSGSYISFRLRSNLRGIEGLDCTKAPVGTLTVVSFHLLTSAVPFSKRRIYLVSSLNPVNPEFLDVGQCY